MQFSVVQGDIAAQRADALVNAAGTSLQMGSGVAGALRRRGGEQLNAAAVAKGPIDLGEVAVTDAFDLDATYVIHAAAMPHYGDGEATAQSIREATRNALEAADERGRQTTSDVLSERSSDDGCTSLVIPALGCGVAGFDLAAGARIICEELAAFDPENLEDVHVIAYSDDEYETIQRVAAEFED